jgi:hypothetical protein
MDECLRCLSLHLEGKFERPCKAGISRFVSLRWRHEAGKIPEIESKPPLHLSVWAWKVPKLPLVRLRVEHSGRVPPVLLDQDGGCTMETAWNSMFMRWSTSEIRFHLYPFVRTDNSAENGFKKLQFAVQLVAQFYFSGLDNINLFCSWFIRPHRLNELNWCDTET